jgi:hypothetical protein
MTLPSEPFDAVRASFLKYRRGARGRQRPTDVEAIVHIDADRLAHRRGCERPRRNSPRASLGVDPVAVIVPLAVGSICRGGIPPSSRAA